MATYHFKSGKFKKETSASKKICTVFQDADRILQIDCASLSDNFVDYHADLLCQLRIAIKEQAPLKVNQEGLSLILHDYEP